MQLIFSEEFTWKNFLVDIGSKSRHFVVLQNPSPTAEFIGQRRIIRYLRYTDTLDGGSVAPFS